MSGGLTPLQAYQHLVDQLQQALPSTLKLTDDRLTVLHNSGWSQVGLLQRQGLAHEPCVLQVLENPALAELAANLLQVPLCPRSCAMPISLRCTP